ncbi:MAG: ring,2-phenylacetyl-CoA epoxidase subunit PaaE [Nocardioidaceae bacterium]|nr:ring,2-phenylacetyl-CoA epoxidase subunit PaaE [Nocardioidaceae bacterium]
MSAPAVPGAAPTRTAFVPLRIAALDRLCDDAVAVTLDVPTEVADRFAFRPGQHVTVRRVVDGTDHRRSYSVCAPVRGPLRIGVRRVTGGVVSGWLVDEATAGDVVEVQRPEGRFTLDPSSGGRHVLVAAGSGITPVLSIAGSLLQESEARVTVVYGNRRSTSTMFLEDLADLKDRYPARFDLVHVLSREPRDVDLFSGRLDGARLATILRTLVPWRDVDGYWLCGPIGMIEEHRDVLRGLGVPSSRVHTELFHVDAPPPPVVHADELVDEDAAGVTLTLDGRTSTVTSPRSRTVLEAAQATRPDVPFACRGGVCGTCRARVLSGRVEMRRNFALEQDEVDQGFVLTCQAVPVTDEVAVDFDA